MPGRLDPHHTAVLIVDVQSKLTPLIDDYRVLVRRAARLAAGAQALHLPLLITELHPRSLGGTMPDLKRVVGKFAAYDEKTRYSAAAGRILETIEARAVRSVVLAGVETHTAVLQTALDLRERGLDVAVCYDAVGSRRREDRDAALRRLEQAGALPTTVESALLEVLGDIAHPHYAVLSEVISSADAAG